MKKRVRKLTVAKDCIYVNFINGVAVCMLNSESALRQRKLRFGKIRNFNAVKCNKKKGCGYSPSIAGIVANFSKLT